MVGVEVEDMNQDLFDQSVLDNILEYVKNTNPVIKPEKIGNKEFYYLAVHPSNQAHVDQLVEDGELIKLGNRLFYPDDLEGAFE